MSHGHDHKDYKRAFGNVEKSSRGLIVLCDGEAPKAGTDVHQQSRTVCLASPMKGCETCEHNTFSITLPVGIGNQIVACPTWETIGDKLDHKDAEYQMVRRQQCLTTRPYDYCSFCPNSRVNQPAEVKLGWWERKMWKED